MTVIELRFLVGRFHATPWGRHVNEGSVEWPPSPWRILRSLIATWFLKARCDVTETALRDLLGHLANHVPGFHLPKATASHTRHYLPVVEGKNEKTTKVFDTFIQIAPSDSVLVVWETDLPPDELTALRVLAERLGYLGRAESLVEARVRTEMDGKAVNAQPLVEGQTVASNAELVRLLSPLSHADYETWRSDFLAKIAPSEEPAQLTAKKKTAPKKLKTPDLPSDLFSALHADTGDLQAAGWTLPPGARWINYTRPSDAFAPASRAPKASGKSVPTVARYAIASTVSPRITQAVSVANRVHDALCKWSDQGSGSAPVFTGLDAEGKPTSENHRHAHVFCEANGQRDAITHITVWAEMGFDENACLALRRLNKVWGHGGHDLRLVLIGIGQPATFPDCKLFGVSKVWRSATPFVSTRHAKKFRDGRPKIDAASGWQIGTAPHDLLRLLNLNPETAGASVRRDREIHVGSTPDPRSLRCLQFQTTRHDGGGRHGHSIGESLSITFPKRISGPLAVGYSSHFGLGLFVSVTDAAV